MEKISKDEREYEEKYGDIPKDQQKRLDWIRKNTKSKRAFDKLEEEIKRIKSIKWIDLSYTIYLLPKGTPRPRSCKSGHFYVKGAADNKRFFKKFYKETLNTPMIETPCKFYCDAYLPIPSGMNILDRMLAELGLIRPINKPDFDNLAKTYSDMTQGILLAEDAYIIEGVSRKWYSYKPRIEIRFSYMEKCESSFNKKRIDKAKAK